MGAQRPRRRDDARMPAPSRPAMEAALAEAETAFRLGRMSSACLIASAAAADDEARDLEVRARIVRGMALFELGDVRGALAAFEDAAEQARAGGLDLECRVALAYFSRVGQFQSPDEALPMLSRVRQLASAVSDAASLGGLHLVVARLEASRGQCGKARRHLEIARQLLKRTDSPALRTSADLVDSSLEMYAGNLDRATASARRGLDEARARELSALMSGCASNLGFLALCAGQAAKAREHLDLALSLGPELSFVRLSVLDTRAQIAIFEGDPAASRAALAACAETIAAQRLPARSWYDLAHQLTRSAHYELLDDWDRVVRISDDVDAELARRQYRAIRSSLLCAKARALARLGRHAGADAALAAAVRTCPRGAVDPLIVLEVSKGLCLGARGERQRGGVHFDRALAACRAIGHQAHERWIERMRASVAPPASAPGDVRPVVAVTDTALLLSDVSAILGAGQAIDLLAQRIGAILQSTAIAPRVSVATESGHDFQAESSASWTTGADGTFTIRLRGSDRLIAIQVRDVHPVEEISLMKSLADLVQVAVARTADEPGDDEAPLWPRAHSPGSDDTVFRSPRMVELLRIALRLAAADLPILLTGETGTGKEVFARLIHEHSQSATGPFVPFNCAAMARELVESQLFGHRRGAFTGATESFAGVIRSAERGTLFLDEIADVDVAVQPKFLRFLESGEIQSVGEARPQTVGVRIVAATNANLDDLVAQGRFRSDLFYRLGVARLALPPLRERKDEIPALAALFLDRFGRECRRTGLRLGDDAVAALLLYDWPGNIRQLSNELRRVVALASDGQTIRSTDFAPEILGPWNRRATAPPEPAGHTITVRADQTLEEAISELEQHFIARAMDAAGGRVADAAQLLGLSRKGLFLKRRRRGLVG